jgi:hypothetical protein
MNPTLALVVAASAATLCLSCSKGDTVPSGGDASFGDTGTGTQFDAMEDTAAGSDDASDAGPGTCAPIEAGVPTTCSVAGTQEAGLVVHNGCTENIDLWWVDYSCVEVFYGQIPTGQQVSQPSFVTHPWRVRRVDAGPVIKEIPPLAAGTTNVQVP